MAYLMWVISIAIVLLVVYMLPAIRRFKQRYDFAQTLTGPSIFGQKAVRKRAGGKNQSSQIHIVRNRNLIKAIIYILCRSS